MMKNILFISCLCFASIAVKAQRRIFLQFGPNVNLPYVNPYKYFGGFKQGLGKSLYERGFGFDGSIGLSNRLRNDRWGYAVKLGYSKISYSVDVLNERVFNNYHYVNAGVYPSLMLKSGIELVLGGNVLLLANNVFEGAKRMNYMGSFGVKKTVRRFNFELAFGHSLVPFQEQPSGRLNLEFYHRTGSLTLGYSLFK
jgi:hypothetical protein